MIKFVHTADLHFGMENYGRIDQKSGIHTRLLDFRKALDACVDFAIMKEVDFFLFAGDAYKTANPSPTQQRLLFSSFLRLFQAKIPVVIIVGNHDHPVSFGKTNSLDLFDQLPIEGFHVISKPKKLILQTKSGTVQIVGIPWPSPRTLALNKSMHAHRENLNNYISDAVTSIIKNYANELDSNLPSVLAGHLSVSSAVFSGSEKRAVYGKDPVFLPSQLAIRPFDYVALGHMHRYQNLNRNGSPAIVYSGSIERIDFGERKEEKGFCFVKIESKNQTSHEFIKIKTRPFYQIEVRFDGSKSQTDTILDELEKYQINDAIIKIIYYLPQGVKDRVDIRAVSEAASKVMHLVGVFPVHKLEKRERRSTLHVDMKMDEMLRNYFSQKNFSQEKIERLIKKTLDFEEKSNLSE